MAEPSKFRIVNWARGHIPTPETIGRYRLLRPFRKQLAQPNLWRFNRRSVPRGVALGLGVGILIPFMHVVLAALLAIPVRANIMLAAAFTLLVNPLTIPPMYVLAYRLGRWELQSEQVIDPAAAAQVSGELARFMFWVKQASGPIAVGILSLALASALIGYIVAAVVWRIWQGSRWSERHGTPAER